jgi:hypothetical protein
VFGVVIRQVENDIWDEASLEDSNEDTRDKERDPAGEPEFFEVRNDRRTTYEMLRQYWR